MPIKLPQALRQTDEILTIGSCFADVMGRHLADHKLNVTINPFGTIFNPVSMAKLLLMALNGSRPDENLYVERDGVWFHYDFHSSLWANSREALTEKLVGTLQKVGETLRRADWLFLTFGTAMVYRHIETGQVVANCHKMPGSLFEKYLYSLDHVRDTLTKLLKALHRANPNLNVLLTVSPVRHTRDTLPVNQVSKSLLRVVCHELTVWHDFVQYFPSYEIMVDDLRDYRFYEADLIHPNAVAHEYIFQKFGESLFDDELRTFIAEWAGIRKSLAHRPLYGPTEGHRRFLTHLLARLEALQGRVDVSAEIASVREQLDATVANRQPAN
ncbi:GSCFA domain-containing protein [Nibrella viscosa]|uniref:GSCFA domain-containing protein n=1 Tax=Nibrella viscosa TaxID=1084524 RepID=A0ABP8K7X0_9BACT